MHGPVGRHSGPGPDASCHTSALAGPSWTCPCYLRRPGEGGIACEPRRVPSRGGAQRSFQRWSRRCCSRAETPHHPRAGSPGPGRSPTGWTRARAHPSPARTRRRPPGSAREASTEASTSAPHSTPPETSPSREHRRARASSTSPRRAVCTTSTGRRRRTSTSAVTCSGGVTSGFPPSPRRSPSICRAWRKRIRRTSSRSPAPTRPSGSASRPRARWGPGSPRRRCRSTGRRVPLPSSASRPVTWSTFIRSRPGWTRGAGSPTRSRPPRRRFRTSRWLMAQPSMSRWCWRRLRRLAG